MGKDFKNYKIFMIIRNERWEATKAPSLFKFNRYWKKRYICLWYDFITEYQDSQLQNQSLLRENKNKQHLKRFQFMIFFWSLLYTYGFCACPVTVKSSITEFTSGHLWVNTLIGIRLILLGSCVMIAIMNYCIIDH